MTKGLFGTAIVACLSLALGSIGPWFAGSTDYGGLDSAGGGTLAMAGLLVIVICRWKAHQRRLSLLLILSLSGICLVTVCYALYDFLVDDAGIGADQVEWGLVLTLLSAAVIALIGIIEWSRLASS